MAKNDLKIKIGVEADTKKLKETSRDIKQIGESANGSSSKVGSLSKKVDFLAHSLQIAHIGFRALGEASGKISDGVKLFGDFEASIKKLGAISGATAKELKALENTSRELGKTTRYSASEVSEAMNFLAMAGLKSADIEQSISGVLNLATIGTTSLGVAADISSNILSGFSLEATKLNEVVDVMSAAITNSNTNIEQMGDAMKYAAPVANSMGISINEVATAIGILGNAGLQGSIAGTSLTQMLQGFSGKTPQAIKAMNELGISVYDSSGKFIGLEKALLNLKQGLSSLSDHQKQNAISKIFGVEAAKSVLVLLDSLGKGYEELGAKIGKSTGLGEKIAKEMDTGLNAALMSLNSAKEELTIAFMQELAPVLTKTTQELTQFIRELDTSNLATFSKEVLELAVSIGKLGGVLAKVSDAMVPDKFVGEEGAGVISLAMKGWKELFTGIADTFQSVENFDLALSFDENSEKIKQKVANLTKEIKEFAKINIEFGIKTEDTTALQNEIKSKMSEIANEISKFQKLYEFAPSQKLQSSIAPLLKEHEELARVYHELEKLEPYKATEIKEATILTNELSQADEKFIESSKKAMQKRVDNHQNTMDKLLNAEQKLSNDIINLKNQEANIISKFDNQRKAALSSFDKKIFELDSEAKSPLEKYIADIERFKQKIQEAKEALKMGEMEDFKRAFNEASSLNERQGAGEKNANLDEYKARLKQLLDLELTGIQTAKAAELNAHQQKMQQKQAELEALKAQMLAQMELYKLQSEALGIKVDKNNLESFKTAISSIDEAIKGLNANETKINVADEEAKTKIESIKQSFGELTLNGKSLEVTADTTAADFGIKKLIAKDDGKKIDIKVNPDFKEAQKKIDELKKKPIKKELTIDATKAKTALKEFEKPSTHKVHADINEAKKLIDELKRPTQSTHTVRVKKVETKASGGLIGEFKRLRGKIKGRDPFGKDDVMALLSRGEFIQNVKAVDYYGVDFFEKLNKRMIPKNALRGYASGGLVLNEINDKVYSSTSGGGGGYQRQVDFSSVISKVQELKKEKAPHDLRSWLSIILRNALNARALSQNSPNFNRDSKKLEQLETALANWEERLAKFLKKIEEIKAKIEDHLSILGGAPSSEFKNSIDETRLSGYEFVLRGLAKQIKEIDEYLAKYAGPGPTTSSRATNRTRGRTGRITELTEIGRKKSFLKAQRRELLSHIPRFSKGGIIPGYGGGDRHLALLESGEGIVRKEAMARLGDGFLHSLNSLKFETAKSATKNVNLNFIKQDGSVLSAISDEATAEALERYLKRYAK